MKIPFYLPEQYYQLIVAWQHQAVAWTSLDLSTIEYCATEQKAIIVEMPMKITTAMFLKITHLKSTPHLPGAGELMSWSMTTPGNLHLFQWCIIDLAESYS